MHNSKETLIKAFPRAKITARRAFLCDFLRILPEALHRNDEGVKPAGTNWTGEISCYIPKFEIHSDMNLIDGLKELGVEKVFDPNTADLTNLFVGTVYNLV